MYHLQANVQVVGDARHILAFQGVVREALHGLMVQEGHHQLPLLLHFHGCCEGTFACSISNQEACKEEIECCVTVNAVVMLQE